MNREIKFRGKMLILIIILGMSLTFLTGCGYGVYEGTVINKEYISAYTTVTMIKTYQPIIPYTQYHPESWRIEIQKEEERNNKNNMDKCYRRCI